MQYAYELLTETMTSQRSAMSTQYKHSSSHGTLSPSWHHIGDVVWSTKRRSENGMSRRKLSIFAPFQASYMPCLQISIIQFQQ